MQAGKLRGGRSRGGGRSLHNRTLHSQKDSDYSPSARRHVGGFLEFKAILLDGSFTNERDAHKGIRGKEPLIPFDTDSCAIRIEMNKLGQVARPI